MSKPCDNCVTQTDYKTDQLHTWCTSCGNYGIWGAMRNALTELQIAPKSVLFVHDIGCNGNEADKIGGYGFKGLHGRAIPLAAGAAVANQDITVIASAGDGAVLSEGIGHLIHGIRSNYNMTLVIHNNANFALTKGQPSPTTTPNFVMSGAPDGLQEDQLNIMQMILPLGPSFAARGFSGDTKQLTSILIEAINHKGFSIVEVMQYCPTYNKATPNEWFLERVFDVSQKNGYEQGDLTQAIEITKDLTERIATGVIYKNEWKQDYNSRLENRQNITTQLVEEVKPYDISTLLEKYT